MENIKYFTKRFAALIALALGLIGSIGGMGYCIYIKEGMTAIGIGILTIMAIPTFIKLFKYITTD